MDNKHLRDLHLERMRRLRPQPSVLSLCSDFKVKVLQEHGKCLGSSLWDSSLILSKYLVAQAAKQRTMGSSAPGISASWHSDHDIVRSSFDEPAERKLVIEIGCGIGLPGIVAGMLGHEVLLTDKAEVLELARQNVEVNQCMDHVSVAELEWGKVDDSISSRSFDLILAADVMYRPECQSPLLQTLLVLCRPGCKIMLAYKQRNVSDVSFFDRAAQHFHIRVLASDPPNPHGTTGCSGKFPWLSDKFEADGEEWVGKKDSGGWILELELLQKSD